MPDKLIQGNRLPQLRFNMIGGGETVLPSDMKSRYLALLFFRGAW